MGRNLKKCIFRVTCEEILQSIFSPQFWLFVPHVRKYYKVWFFVDLFLQHRCSLVCCNLPILNFHIVIICLGLRCSNFNGKSLWYSSTTNILIFWKVIWPKKQKIWKPAYLIFLVRPNLFSFFYIYSLWRFMTVAPIQNIEYWRILLIMTVKREISFWFWFSSADGTTGTIKTGASIVVWTEVVTPRADFAVLVGLTITVATRMGQQWKW